MTTIAYNKKYYADHKSALVEYARNYRVNNRYAVLRAAKNYRNNHQAEIRAWNRTPRARFLYLKKQALRQFRRMSLTFDFYVRLISLTCFYCGGLLPETGIGLDRIDSSKGYVKGNVRPCCTVCNRWKSDMSESNFREHIMAASSWWAGKKA